jgi:hypothetical protein
MAAEKQVELVDKFMEEFCEADFESRPVIATGKYDRDALIEALAHQRRKLEDLEVRFDNKLIHIVMKILARTEGKDARIKKLGNQLFNLLGDYHVAQSAIRTGKFHLKRVPEGLDDLRRGHVLVHNQVRPTSGRPGQSSGIRGFRFWSMVKDDTIEVCPCRWAAHLPEHYRVIKAWKVIEQLRETLTK